MQIIPASMHALRNFALTALGLCATVGLLNLLVPDVVRVESFAEQEALAAREYCQVMFVGPSYVAGQILPEVFDDEARRIGLHARACKLGKVGLRGYELLHQIQQLLRHDWPKLELLVIDITIGQKVGFESGNWFKSRMLEWHTWDAVPWLFGYYQRDSRSWLEKLPEAWVHLEHVAAHYLLLGRGTSVLASSPGADAVVDEGDAPLEDAMHRTDEPVGPHPGYARKLRHLKHMLPKVSRKRDSSAWPIELRSLVRAHGLEAFFLYAPIWHALPLPGAALDGDDRLVVLDFIDPDRYPELYTEAVRGYTHHLRGDGYAIYSRLLARELAQRWSPKR